MIMIVNIKYSFRVGSLIQPSLSWSNSNKLGFVVCEEDAKMSATFVCLCFRVLINNNRDEVDTTER